MTDRLWVILEVGKTPRRIVAAAMVWPGLERWGRTEEGARHPGCLPSPLCACRPTCWTGRCVRAGARGGGRGSRTRRRLELHQLLGDGRRPFADRAGGRLRGRARAAAQPAAGGLGPLRRGRGPRLARATSRTSGRSRDKIIVHVYASERHNWWRKLGIRESDEVRLTPEELAGHRRRYLDAVGSYNADARPARTWPIQFLIRRTAHHLMDHDRELQDRSLS